MNSGLSTYTWDSGWGHELWVVDVHLVGPGGPGRAWGREGVQAADGTLIFWGTNSGPVRYTREDRGEGYPWCGQRGGLSLVWTWGWAFFGVDGGEGRTQSSCAGNQVRTQVLHSRGYMGGMEGGEEHEQSL
eukprot:353556-Chlamydomonas_euryale.AAC.1